ncbi:MAG: hypothetical protein K0R84_2204 [Clostridia bacterium]|nr:hypothetical protein [Clostridia bacterium]
MDKKRIFIRELIGFFLISILGTLLHFCFEWSGSFKPLAWLCAVNESVWEHLKIGFWPALFYTIYEYFSFGSRKRNFWTAKAADLYTIPLSITIVYYIVKAITGRHFLWLDIVLFVASIALAQLISYRIITSRKDYSKYTGISLFMIILLTIAFSLFSYFPPKLDIFKDVPTGTYGIPKK